MLPNLRINEKVFLRCVIYSILHHWVQSRFLSKWNYLSFLDRTQREWADKKMIRICNNRSFIDNWLGLTGRRILELYWDRTWNNASFLRVRPLIKNECFQLLKVFCERLNVRIFINHFVWGGDLTIKMCSSLMWDWSPLHNKVSLLAPSFCLYWQKRKEIKARIKFHNNSFFFSLRDLCNNDLLCIIYRSRFSVLALFHVKLLK